MVADVASSFGDDAIPASLTSRVDSHETKSGLFAGSLHVVIERSALSIQIGKVSDEVFGSQSLSSECALTAEKKHRVMPDLFDFGERMVASRLIQVQVIPVVEEWRHRNILRSSHESQLAFQVINLLSSKFIQLPENRDGRHAVPFKVQEDVTTYGAVYSVQYRCHGHSPKFVGSGLINALMMETLNLLRLRACGRVDQVA